MTGHVKVSGTWRDVSEAHVKVAGTWKQAELWCKVAGTWKQIIQAVTLTLSNVTVSNTRAGSTCTAGLRLEADGDIMGSTPADAYTSDRGDWISPKSAAGGAYECRATVTSGSLTSGTTGSWLALSSDRTWNVQQGSIGTKSCTFTLEIREVANTSNIVSATITLSATFEL